MLCSRNLNKGINTWAVPSCNILGAILEMDEGRTSTDEPKDKKYKADAQGLTFGRSYHHHHHHHHVVPLARISLILSRHFSLLFIASGRSSRLHPVSSHSCCMYVRLVVLLLFGHKWGSIRVHHLLARLCFSSSALHVWIV